MCGIIGYIGNQQAVPILLDGLSRLEYRGYDSAGLAIASNGGVSLRKCAGRINSLREIVDRDTPSGSAGVSHTRWATHGEATDDNAHPHFDQSGRLALVHNGVIENYQELRDDLTGEGHEFVSQTDSEVLAHLIGRHYDAEGGVHGDARLGRAVREALKEVSGTYGIAVMHADVPKVIMGARLGSPLVVGLGRNENFLSSDVAAIVAHTSSAIYLNDYDIVTLSEEGYEVDSMGDEAASVEVSRVDFNEGDADMGEFPHFMLKEIYEQPKAITNALRGRLSRDDATAKLGGLNMSPQELRDVDRMVLLGCGTAAHAAMVGEYMIEALARVPTEVEIASEFRYRNMPTGRNTLLFVISQSGETIDTLAAMREGQRKGHRVLGICNNVASTIARESDGGVYMHAGPEIGVAATKSFTSQVVIMNLLALLLGRMHHLSVSKGLELIDELQSLPEKVEETLKLDSHIKEIALKYADVEGMLFLGRQFNYPAALEGALKMKEITYMFASGHASAELKHGVIALVNESLPSVFIAPDDTVFEKNVSNIEEVKARKGPVIAVTTEGRAEMERVADDVIYIPRCAEHVSPVLATIPLQLLSYHVAVARGCDVDKPRNLAKSVTVE
ncbi:MAG: glutamine--fructose-6-phosphate transaminase (isomerizing) [Verrucomicrobiota bacterium]